MKRSSVRNTVSAALPAVIAALLTAPADAASNSPGEKERDQAIIDCMTSGTAECDLDDYKAALDPSLWPSVDGSLKWSETKLFLPALSGTTPAEAFRRYAIPDSAETFP